MAENRQYAGPHTAADLMVADGVYVSVVHQDYADDASALEALGYTLDVDEAVPSGKTFVRKTVTISDELAVTLDEESWPRVGGTASDDSIVDDPSSNPVTRSAREIEEDLPTPEELRADQEAELAQRQAANVAEAEAKRLAEVEQATARIETLREAAAADGRELTKPEAREVAELEAIVAGGSS